MCLALEYEENIMQTVQQIKASYDKLRKLVSELDIRVNNLYHEIEVKNLNASAGFKKYKELQKALRERRVVKQEFANIDYLLKALDISNLETKIHKSLNNTKKSHSGNKEYREGWNITIEDIMTSAVH